MLNKGFGALVGLGLDHNYLLEVQGRKTYRVDSLPSTCWNSWGRASSLLLADAHHGSVTPRPQANRFEEASSAEISDLDRFR